MRIQIMLGSFGIARRISRASPLSSRRFYVDDSRFPSSLFRKEWLRPFGAIRRIACGDIEAKEILTPGHSRGSVCYWFDELGILLSGDYVSEYATSATQEDFAETFMLFVKHKGKIPARFAKKPAIRKKWKSVAEIVKRVAAAKR